MGFRGKSTGWHTWAVCSWFVELSEDVLECAGPRIPFGEEIRREVEDLLEGGGWPGIEDGVLELGGVGGPDGAADDGALVGPRRDHDGGAAEESSTLTDSSMLFR